MQTVPLFIAGGFELLIIGFALLILFIGPKKLPELSQSTGRSLGEFKKGQEKTERELEEMRESD